MLSERIQQLESSGIRKFFDIAFGSKQEFIDFSIGQPDFQIPREVKKAAQLAIDKNHNKYTQTQGIIELREALVKKLANNDINTRHEDIIVTTGTSGGLFLALSAILDPGDGVIMTDPYFVLYYQMATFLGAKIALWDTYPDFQLKLDSLPGLITKKTKAIIVNSPNNPTGAVYSESDLRDLAKIAQQHKLVLLSDEIYEHFDYDKKFTSIGSIYKNTITFNGFSKSHAMTGWRIGYAHGPSEIIQEMSKLQQYTYICAPAPAQYAALKALEVQPEELYQGYKHKRDLVYKELKDTFELTKPGGAFFAFVKKPENRNEFTEEAIEHGVLIVPGEVFSSQSSHFRLSFALDNDRLKQGIAKLKEIV